MPYIPLYCDSHKAARIADEVDLWARSLAENIVCAKAIEREIGGDASRLDNDTAIRVISEFGYDRVNWVLAATVQQGGHEHRISDDNKAWATAFQMPPHRTETIDYRVDSSPGTLDAFISQVRQAWQELGLSLELDENEMMFDRDMEPPQEVDSEQTLTQTMEM